MSTPDPSTPRPYGGAKRLCRADELLERGKGMLFEVLEYGRRAPAFALRFEGKVVAYLNRCVHVPTTLDWQPGEFLDADQRWLLCSVHGASYEPHSGRCVGGPCGRGKLTAIEVAEVDGWVVWYPNRDIQPLPSSSSSLD
mgnify:CR=1 FL=1